MFRKLFFLLVLLSPIGAFAQAPCPVGTNGSAVVLVNDSTTGTAINKIVSLTTAGNAIIYPHTQTVGAVGVAYYGAGLTPNSGVCVQQTGSIPIIGDGAIAIQHWVTTSTTVDGNIHDTGTSCTALPPGGVEVVGCSVTSSSGAGIAALISLRSFVSAFGITQSGTAISGTTCVIIASGTNTIQCGTATDTGTYFQPKEILDLQQNALTVEETTAAGTYTVNKLTCVTASGTIGDCATAAAGAFAIGVNKAKNGSTPVTQQIGVATVTTNASITATQGDIFCNDASNAAVVVDNSGSSCPQGQKQIGVAAITDGGNSTTHTAILTILGPPNGSQTIASGTAVMGTSAIASGACATVVTVSGTGTATTDVITVGFNGDPTAVTGYGASATGAVLTIYPYPTANNANFKVCNSTASSITPGALTLNWRVVR